MRLAARTGIAAVLAAAVSMLLIGAVFNRLLSRELQDRVDEQLRERAATAPVLAAVGDRLAQSELGATVEGARVLVDGETTPIGLLPDDPLPPIGEPGFASASADGQRWRLLTIDVVDVPRVGDRAMVQLVAPLGDVDARTQQLRRRLLLIAAAAAAIAGLLGTLFGRLAARPLAQLHRDAGRIDDADPATWTVAPAYGSADVDEVATALNDGLARLRVESEQRAAALDAARAFAAAATHELRTPLQSAMTNIDIARSPLVDDAGRDEAVQLAHGQLNRIAAGLAAVRALADAEFADESWFVPTDVLEVVESAVAEEGRRADVEVTVAGESGPPVALWRDGARLAIANVVRNALVHGAPADGGQPAVSVTVAGAAVTVDDRGPGIPAGERDRVLRRFERGSGSSGSGLGLAIAHQVAHAHGGAVEIGTSPGGGCRVVVRLGPDRT